MVVYVASAVIPTHYDTQGEGSALQSAHTHNGMHLTAARTIGGCTHPHTLAHKVASARSL